MMVDGEFKGGGNSTSHLISSANFCLPVSVICFYLFLQ